MGVTKSDWERIEACISKVLVKELNDQFGDMDRRIALAFASESVQKEIQPFFSKLMESVVKGAITQVKEEMETKITVLSRQLDKLKEEMNDIDQYQRRMNILIHNIPESDHENCDSVVLKFLQDDMKLDVQQDMIQRCHRLGSPREKGKGHRPLIVRFVSYRVRQQVFAKKKMLKQVKPGVFVTENLTKRNLDLYHKVRLSKLFERTWTNDGKILAVKDGVIVRICCAGDLAKYCTQ